MSTRGRLACVSGPAEFDRIVQGDVLVTESTSEAFNILLPLLGAIVTDSGGLLSHSAIVAREYGIPGVVGTREATERIADGDARARRRRRRRSDGPRVKDVVPLAKAQDTRDLRLEGGRARAGDAGRPSGPAGRCALRRRSSRRSPAGTSRRSSRSRKSVRAARRAARGPLVRRRTRTARDASFAGQHLTLLNVPSAEELTSALSEIWWSANSDSAITYRQRVGLFTRPSVGVVVQVAPRSRHRRA